MVGGWLLSGWVGEWVIGACLWVGIAVPLAQFFRPGAARTTTLTPGARGYGTVQNTEPL